jgi:TolB-like protein
MEKPFPAYAGSEPYVFVCYAHDDASVVYPELEKLRAAGINIWYDEGISAGSNWRAAIGESLLGAGKFLLYLSPQSLVSAHCNREVNLALDTGLEIVPVCLETTPLTADLQLGLSRLQALDIREDGYRDRLLRVLSSQQENRSAPATAAVTPISTANRNTARRTVQRVLLAVLVALVAIVWWQYSAEDVGGDGLTGERAVVVLPFINVKPDAADNYLANGVADELRYVLEKIPDMRVASRTAAEHVVREALDPEEIGRELGVDYLLEGSIRRKGNSVNVKARLLRISDGSTISTVEVVKAADDLLELQTELALLVVNAIAGDLSEVAQRAASLTGTDSERAFELYLQAVEFSRRDNASDLLRAENLLEAAIEEDPDFLRAYQSLELVLPNVAARTGRFAEYAQKNRMLAERMEAQFTPDQFVGMRRPGGSLAFLERDWRLLEIRLADMLREGVDLPFAYRMYGYHLANAGLFKAALEYRLVAQDHNPFDPGPIEQIGDMYFALGDLEQALVAYQRCLLLAPERAGCLNNVGWTLYAQGQVDAALAHFGDNPPSLLACLQGRSHSCEVPKDSAYPTFAGYLAAAAGDLNAAFAWFDKAATEHDIFINQIRWQHPSAVDLEADPRYEALLTRLGLDDAWQNELCERAGKLTRFTGVAVVCE